MGAATPERQEKTSNFRASLVTLAGIMTRNALICLLALFLVEATHADSVKDALNHKYKKQVLALRAPLAAGNQKFDSAGHSLNGAPNSHWLIYGGIYVEKLNLSPDTLRLEGPRAATAADKKNGKAMLVRFSKSQRIEIHLDQPLKSLDEAEAVMGRVFLFSADAAERARPELRRADDNTPDDEIYHVSMHAFRRPDDKAPEMETDDGKKENVLPPRPTYTPEPEFSEEARRAKYQGTVVMKILVNKAGEVVRVRLERALGMGLDQNAMEGVTRWRFSPATHNGQPVAVEMNIEVAFNLY
jgi:TonB family protein